MDEYESLSHSKWECKYHVVFILKCPRKVLYGNLRKHLGAVFRKLAEQKECRIEEGHLLADHVHMMISIPPKYAVSQVVGFIKGKSAIHLARVYGELKQNYAGQSFWARGYFVSTVGRDEATIREYIRNQEKEDQRIDQMNLWKRPCHLQVAQLNWGRVSYPSSRFERLTKESPGSAGGTFVARPPRWSGARSTAGRALPSHSWLSFCPLACRNQNKPATLLPSMLRIQSFSLLRGSLSSLR